MSKRRKITLAILVIFISIFIGSIILNKTYRTNFKSLDSTDQKMLTELSTIYQNFKNSSDQLWDRNYHFEQKPLILIRTHKDRGILREEAYALNIEDMGDSIFAKQIEVPTSLSLPKVFRLSRLDPKMISTWFPSNFGTIDIGGKEVYYFKYHPKMMEDPDLYFDFPSFLLHEGFHIYKQHDWTYDLNDQEHIENYPYKQENFALMGLEFTLLDRAMATNDPEAVKKELHDWAIVRKYRNQQWPQLKGEMYTEAIEGSARYLEYRYSRLVGGKLTVLATTKAPYHITFMDAFNAIADGQAESLQYLKRSIRYETGSALELLMDQAHINWKEEIEDHPKKRGKTQYEILHSTFKLDTLSASEIKKDLERIKKDLHYTDLLKQAEKMVTKQPNDK
ncbi:hypothetical protein [Thermoactinomyces sp. DSM 45892]|uniref:hypothetical protein n=1 Tax=Thermoactinomyces sp. DSM 45892 TaxID=1882753 RepID=UPI000898A85B|nr:hypothetical protein [Thermoactinomyces sp. DSM 45892]SDY13360.1 hypothetical protein SAMN05444416_10296 [Thermoactinomyces sp. DSM 45892]